VSLALQSVLVALIVAWCALFAAWRLASVALRLRVLDALGAMPAVLTAPWLARLRARTLARAAGSCAGCASGGAESRGRLRPGADSPNRTPGALRR
jgi:hypothetical protein